MGGDSVVISALMRLVVNNREGRHLLSYGTRGGDSEAAEVLLQKPKMGDEFSDAYRDWGYAREEIQRVSGIRIEVAEAFSFLLKGPNAAVEMLLRSFVAYDICWHVRRSAARALHRLRTTSRCSLSEETINELVTASREDPAVEVRIQASHALGKVRRPLLAGMAVVLARRATLAEQIQSPLWHPMLSQRAMEALLMCNWRDNNSCWLAVVPYLTTMIRERVERKIPNTRLRLCGHLLLKLISEEGKEEKEKGHYYNPIAIEALEELKTLGIPIEEGLIWQL